MLCHTGAHEEAPVLAKRQEEGERKPRQEPRSLRLPKGDKARTIPAGLGTRGLSLFSRIWPWIGRVGKVGLVCENQVQSTDCGSQAISTQFWP